MNTWSRGRTLAAGVLLVLLTNAVALGGAWWNREGEPESTLVLSERELALPYRGYRLAENSGLALRLGWRVAQGDGIPYSGFAANGGAPDWLDAERMAALGFDASEGGAGDADRRRYTRQLPREVLIVLELAGADWQQALERARENAARHAAAAAANADSKEFANRARSAQAALQREERSNSRLFAIDVGFDLAALRARHPDRARCMIVRGTVRPYLVRRDKATRLSGYIGDVGVSQINVPFALRPVLERLPARPAGKVADAEPRFEARLAVGRRLEPWIAGLAATATQ